MFQPRVKLEFVKRYCPPDSGWTVYVDVDASEEGRTGGERRTDQTRVRQQSMVTDGEKAKNEMRRLGITVGAGLRGWSSSNALPRLPGDSDIVAFHRDSGICVVVEVEGASSGQPEQKLYKAVGQIIRARSEIRPTGWKIWFGVVVHDADPAKPKMKTHFDRMTALNELQIAGLALHSQPTKDVWIFGTAPSASC